MPCTVSPVTTTTYTVRLGDDGRTLFTSDSHADAEAFAIAESARNWAGKARLESSRSGIIARYENGACVGYLSGAGQWVRID